MLCFSKNTDGGCVCWLQSEYPVVQIRFKLHILNRWGENSRGGQRKWESKSERERGREVKLRQRNRHLNKVKQENIFFFFNKSWGVPLGCFSPWMVGQELMLTYRAGATFCVEAGVQSNRNRLAAKQQLWEPALKWAPKKLNRYPFKNQAKKFLLQGVASPRTDSWDLASQLPWHSQQCVWLQKQ